MKVTHVAAEMAPLAKTGGLGDVLGALPRAQAALGADVEVVLPFHRMARGNLPTAPIADPAEITTWVGGHRESFRAHRLDHPTLGLPVLLLESRRYFERDTLYDEPTTRQAWADNPARFTAFAQAAIELLRRRGRGDGILHLHDHHTGLIPAYIRDGGGDPAFSGLRIVFTIHNLGYQGLASWSDFSQAGFPSERFSPLSPYEFHGQLSFLKVGLCFADAITTVSPTYAEEIRTPALGFGLDGLLRHRESVLSGILNGIDPAEWDPGTDPRLPARYSARKLAGKERAKEALRDYSRLPARAEAPVIGMVTRLVPQKGLDLLEAALDDILDLGVQLVVLGFGEWRYHDLLERAADARPGQVAAHLRFDDDLAHLVEAGSDLYLMPSRYEPCGLNQLYSLRYGTPPIVRRTGGLADTVRDADARKDGTGFVFDEASGPALLDAVRRAVLAWRRPRRFRAIQRRAMAEDFSWQRSARQYLQLYARLLER